MTTGSSVIPPASGVSGGSLSDLGAVGVAVATAAGAWWCRPLPVALGAVVVAGALARRRPVLLGVGGLLLASALGARSMDGLTPPVPGSFEGVVTLVADPAPSAFGVRVDVRAGSGRYELQAADGAAGAVLGALTGERVAVVGRLRPPPADAPWLVPRHVRGVLVAERAEVVDGGAGPWRAANRFRRLLVRGAEHLPEPTRSLYGGFVLGDDRGQPPEVVDDFRASGLTHLLVVSGQNVAYVLVLAGPLARRLRLGARWALTLAVIASFALLTRFEPSVLRASAMAAVAVTAVLAGRTSGTLRTLAVAVAALLLIDPLLVRSVAFQLSVAASAGIALLGRRITRSLPGPVWWREVLGVTVAAQVGVAPVIIPRFGGMPVVSIVANLLAVPPSGLVTSWGLPAGVVAGVLGPPVATVVHLPTRLLIEWVAGVARIAAAVPLGEVGATEVVVAVGASWAMLRIGRHRRRREVPPPAPTRIGSRATRAARTARAVELGLAAVAVGALLAPAWGLRSPPPHVEVVPGVHLHRGGGGTVVVFDGGASAARVLEGLRLAGVRRLDVVVTAEPLRRDLDRALRHRWPVGRVLVTTEVETARLQVGALVIELDRGLEVVEVAHLPP